ncbi:MAG: hypothetical protein ACLPLR_08780 [Terriglobales bacterium]
MSDLSWMSDEEYSKAQQSYQALMDLREKIFEVLDLVDDSMRQHPMYSRASYTLRDARYAGLNREEYQQVKYLEKLYEQIGKEAVKQDKDQDDKKASEWGLSSESDEELIARFNREVGCGGWVSARGRYLTELHQEFAKRFDYSAIGNASALSLARKIKLVGKKIVVDGEETTKK